MTVSREEVRRRQRLTRAMKNPRAALEGGWVEDPKFCAAFLDGAEQLAFVQSREVLRIGRRAVEVADAGGDPHLLHRSYGVLSHAYIARRELYWAGRTLKDVRERALACCPRCRSDHFRRLGDLLGEEGRLDDSLAALGQALEAGGCELDADARGRIHYLRGISHHLRGDRRRALADAGSTLELVDLASPRGFFVDSPALIAVFAGGGDPQDDALGSALLAAFEQRIKGLRGWGDWTARRMWADAHLQARLGRFECALPLMRRAYLRLLAGGLPREAVAVTLDLGQLYCRAGLPSARNWKAAKAALERCLARRADLPEAHRTGLGAILDVLEHYPESAFEEMVQLRRSFIAPVPGVMAERIGPREWRDFERLMGSAKRHP